MYIVLRAEKGRNQKESKGKRCPFFELIFLDHQHPGERGPNCETKELPPEHDPRDVFAEHLWLFPHPIPFNIAPRSPTTAARSFRVTSVPLVRNKMHSGPRSCRLQDLQDPIQSRSEHSKKPRNAAIIHQPRPPSSFTRANDLTRPKPEVSTFRSEKGTAPSGGAVPGPYINSFQAARALAVAEV